MLRALLTTIYALFAGFALSVLAGLPLGILLGGAT